MKQIEDTKKLSELTIPGTHDSMALYYDILGAQCQSWSVKDQLNAGIRYLDLRVSDNLRIVHSFVPQHSNFFEVLCTIREFLTDHSSETVLVRVKPEHTPNAYQIQDDIAEIVLNYDDVLDSIETQTLTDVRGKVILVQKNEFKLGIKVTNTDGPKDYKVFNIERKKRRIEKHLEEAGKKCGEDLMLSYSSGTGLNYLRYDLRPPVIAKQINPWLNNYLKTSLKNSACLGIIAMDFPGTDLIKTIFDLNKNQKQQQKKN